MSDAEVFGQRLAQPVQANEPISAAKLGVPIEAINIPDGTCAVSVQVSDVQAVGGAVVSGSRVAVYAVEKDNVQLLFVDVLVLATSNGAEAPSSTASYSSSLTSKRSALSWVTLAVPENQVQEIIAASRSGSLYLVLPGGE
jgi:pilus assembly protein CpaB